MDDEQGYARSLNDWIACCIGGAQQPASVAAGEASDGLEGSVMRAATAGHVLDFDDTYLPGLAHLSAPVAPAAIMVAARLGARVADVLDAYAAGFERMGALARVNHPALYERGWHPTSVCGVVGSAVAASHLLELTGPARTAAIRLAMLAAGGLRAAFGSDGKALQVGFAAAAGVRAARLAAAGSTVGSGAVGGFEAAYGATFEDASARPAIEENWIKAYPCCLQTHGSIEAALSLREQGVEVGEKVSVVVHPVSRQAASYDDVATGLEAKFSIPYTVAYALVHGAPGVDAFERVDEGVRDAARFIEVETDDSLLESEARLQSSSGSEATVEAALGSPERPMTDRQLADKVSNLTGTDGSAWLADPSAPAASLSELIEPSHA